MTETEGEKKNHGGKRTESRRKEKGQKMNRVWPFRGLLSGPSRAIIWVKVICSLFL